MITIDYGERKNAKKLKRHMCERPLSMFYLIYSSKIYLYIDYNVN